MVFSAFFLLSEASLSLRNIQFYIAQQYGKKSRIIFTEEQKNALLKFYEEGMTSTKKEMADRIHQCASTIAISEEQVKVI